MLTTRHVNVVAAPGAGWRPCERDRRSARVKLAERTRTGAAAVAIESKSAEYTEIMKEKMKWDQDAPYDYKFERGLYYHHILENKLLCGSQPTTADDIRYLKDVENVGTIISLQEEKDPHHWGVDTGSIHHAMNECGIHFIRTEVVDFDKESLRRTLPRAVHHTARAINSGKKVYVHCTAGLGRAPATCIAYMYWMSHFSSLDQAYEHLTRIRPCGPNRDAIRGATYDMLSGWDWHGFQSLAPDAFASLQKIHKKILQHHLVKGQY